jgi:hypothetical protein
MVHFHAIYSCFLIAGYNPKVLLFSNYNNKWMVSSSTLPPFHKEILTVWSELGNSMNVTQDQCIWYNKDILIQGKSVFYEDFLAVGIN